MWNRRRLPLANPSAQMLLFAAPEDYPAPEVPDALAVATSAPYAEEPGPSCVRSPCVSMRDVWDPKISSIEIAAAREEVGTPKLRRGMVELALEPTGKVYASGERKGEPKTRPVPVWQDTEDHYRPGEPDWPLAVSYGIGIDSTAILVGLAQIVRETGDERFRPRWITFADTGAEKASTYAYLRLLNRWLASIGFPTVTTVAWARGLGDKLGDRSWGRHRTLEQNCLNNHTMPSISASKFKRSECSVTWKHDPQDRWFRDHSGYFVPTRGHNCTSGALAALSPEGGIDARAVAESAQCSVGTLRPILAFLIGEGLAFREKSGRSFVYFATALGVQVRDSGSLMTVKMVMPVGTRIVKAIGYDSTEEARLDPNAEGSTFRAGDGDDPDAHDYSYWYPLMEWSWERSRCYAEIEAELAPTWHAMVAAGELDPNLLLGPVPGKSSCFFCGAMKPEEIRYLSNEDLHRAILLELVALRGRHPSTVLGLAVNWSWADYAAGKVTKGMSERARQQVEEFGRLLSEEEMRDLSDLADAWIEASPKVPATFDVSEVGHEMGLLAFVKMRGLRGDPEQLGWDIYEEKRGKARSNPPLPYDPLLEGSG